MTDGVGDLQQHVPNAPPAPGLLRGRGMLRRLGPMLTLFARRFLDRIPLPEADAARIRQHAERGAVIVYVHRSRNSVEHLALTRTVQRDQLPQARYVGGINVAALAPLWSLPRLVSRWLKPGVGRDADEVAALEACLHSGHAAEVFLRRPLTLLSTDSAYRVPFVEVMVRVQRTLARPIVLVPVFLALRQRPGNFEPTTFDALLGTIEEPGLMRALFRVMAAGGHARFEVSEPVDLQAFVSQHASLDDAVLAKKVRWVLLHHLARVERMCHGPAQKSPARLREAIAKDGQLVALKHELRDTNGIPHSVTERRIDKVVSEIAATPDIDLARLLSRGLDMLWRRLYDGIIVDEAAFAAIREAGRKGPLVFVPSHRSHVDYLVLSQLMLKRGLLPPLVAAGENLNFFPIGGLFRRGGAFFLRRTMKGDRFYVAVFKAYVRHVFAEGHALEFFIEGGRSRTGKTLPPKLGLLSMVVEAFLDSRERDATFIPCHIAYERVIEAGSYASELSGAPKERESAAQLAKATSVLARRYGRVYVNFDTPLSLAEHLAGRGIQTPTTASASAVAAVDPPQQTDRLRDAIATLGHRIAYGINRAGPVTAISLVCASMIGLRRTAVDRATVQNAAELLLHTLLRLPAGAARFVPGLVDAPREHILAGCDALVRDGLLRGADIGGRQLLSVAPDAVLEVDAHKNHLLHLVAPECIIATALRMVPLAKGSVDQRVARAALHRASLELSRLLKRELIFAYGVGFDGLFEAALARAHDSGLLRIDGDAVVLPQDEQARGVRRFARQLLRGMLQCMSVVAQRAAQDLPATEKAFALATTNVVRAMTLTGELDAAEAASKATVDNTIELLCDRRVLTRNGGELSVLDSAALLAVSEKLSPAAARRHPPGESPSPQIVRRAGSH